jgi:two-component system response regulator NreC
MSGHLHLAPALIETDAGVPECSSIRVVLADDHALMRHSLRSLLESEPGVEVIAEADDLASAVHQVYDRRPHVLVLDLRMPDGSSVETIGELRARMPDTHVVVLTMNDNPAFARQALDCGALGFVLKERADDELPRAVRAAARGEEYISPSVAARLMAGARERGEDCLSARELEVLKFIAQGHTSVEIARKLQISPRTVESHRARIHAKLGLVTRAELVRDALGRGLLEA